MKVSVITPAYNSAQYIRGTIESILIQTSGLVEHIIVDGGSTDGTVEILRSYPHLKWISEPDRGMYDAINKGIRMASGDIIAYLNSDDRYFNYTIQTVLEAFTMNPQVDFIYGYCVYIDEQGRELFVVRPLPYRWAKYALTLLWPQPSWFWKREIHDRVGLFDDTLRHTGDAEFMRRLVVHGIEGKLIRSVLAKFMVRDDSISVQFRDNYNRERKMCRVRYQADRWTIGRIGAEVLFAFQNITMYSCLLRYRLRYRHKIDQRSQQARTRNEDG